MREWLAASGLTVGQVTAQVIYFFVTIGVAYFSAKFGASESRRQYEEKAEIDKRQAAADLIHPLLAFAFQCDRCISDIDFANSANTDADRLRVVQDLQLSAGCNRNAAVLGSEVAARVPKIQVLKTRIENGLRVDFNVGCPAPDREAPGRLASWLSLLELRARYAADLAAKAAGLPVSHTEKELEALLKAAMRHGSEIDSGDIERWH
jgi:hypothetical protein